MKEKSNDSWRTEQAKFMAASLIGIGLMIYSFFATPIYDTTEIQTKTVRFKSAKFKPGTRNQIERFEIKVFNSFMLYEVWGYDLMCMDRKAFLKIEHGDTIVLTVKEDEVVQINFKGDELINELEANEKKHRNRIGLRLIGLMFFVVLLMPNFLSKQPVIKTGRRKYKLVMNEKVFAACLIVLMLFLLVWRD